MDFDQLYPKRFMKAGEFQGRDLTLTIGSVRLEELGEGQEKKGKAVVGFRETKKEWVMNVTNGQCLKAMFGRDTDKWLGKRVTLYPAEVADPFTGELTIAIRVRGSPDIEAPLSFSARVGRKSVNFKMAKTQVRGQKAQAPAALVAPGPIQDYEDSPLAEPPDDYPLPSP